MKNKPEITAPALLSIFSLLLLMQITACSPFPPTVRPAPDLPEHYTGAEARRTSSPTPQWWKDFNSLELDELVEKSLKGNFTIRSAWAKLRQTRAGAVKAGAGRYPNLNLEADQSISRARSGEDGARSTHSYEDHGIGLVSSYEIDLWGRVRSEHEAARLDAEASREDVGTAAMTLAADVTEHWIRIISSRLEKRLLEKQLETNRTYLELVELRFRKGMASALDVYQQKQIAEDVQAQIPLAEETEQLLTHELAVLTGEPPASPMAIRTEKLPTAAPVPHVGIPADLLANRPDIRAARKRLEASDRRTASARADRLPAIRLTGRAGFGAEEMDLLFDNWLLSLAGNLAAPIFDADARAAEVERTLAAADERLWSYRQTVLTAVKEVENALVSENRRRRYIEGLRRQMDTGRKALELAVERYRKGLSDYLPVLTQILSVQRLERELIQQETELLGIRIGLHRALGGTWTESLSM